MNTAVAERTDSSPDREALILQHYPIVRRIAYRLVARYPSSVDVDDLITIGMLGLIEAVDRFDHARSVSFTGYAKIRVQGAIVDELRKQDWVPRSVRDRATRIQRMRDTLTETLGRAPTDEELANSLGVDVERLHELTRDSIVRSVVSIDDKDGDDISIRNQLASDDVTPADVAMSGCLRERVLGAVRNLPDRERQLVDLYYFRNQSIKEIASTFGVTESRVSQLHTRTKKRLGPLLEPLVEVSER